MYGNVTLPPLSFIVLHGDWRRVAFRYMDCRPFRARARALACVTSTYSSRSFACARTARTPSESGKIDERAYVCDAWHVLIVPGEVPTLPLPPFPPPLMPERPRQLTVCVYMRVSVCVCWHSREYTHGWLRTHTQRADDWNWKCPTTLEMRNIAPVAWPKTFVI